MYDQLLRRLNQLVLLTPPQQRSLCKALKVVEHPKDEVLLEAGQVSNHIYFMREGILRASHQHEDKDVTRWFCFAGHFAAAHFSFVYRQPSEDRLVLVTDAKLLALSHTALQQLSQQDPVWIDLNRHLLEHYYTTSLERVLDFQTRSAPERYQRLLEARPDIETKVPLGHLASFLGMSQETLSRLRRKRKKQQQATKGAKPNSKN